MSTSLLLVPISLLLAVILPGNQVLPFVIWHFHICDLFNDSLFQRNIVRSLVGCSLYLVMTFYLSTWLAPIVTELFQMANFDVGTGD